MCSQNLFCEVCLRSVVPSSRYVLRYAYPEYYMLYSVSCVCSCMRTVGAYRCLMYA